jgi:hypothetical protein
MTIWKCKQCGYIWDSTNEDMECPQCLSPSIKKYSYCWFATVEEIIKDHKWLKKDIKRREKQCDRLVAILNQYIWMANDLPSPQAIAEEVEQMAHEMMCVNI